MNAAGDLSVARSGSGENTNRNRDKRAVRDADVERICGIGNNGDMGRSGRDLGLREENPNVVSGVSGAQEECLAEDLNRDESGQMGVKANPNIVEASIPPRRGLLLREEGVEISSPEIIKETQEIGATSTMQISPDLREIEVSVV